MRKVKVARERKYDDNPDTRDMQWVARNKIFRNREAFTHYGRRPA